jgi:hypothetical protein
MEMEPSGRVELNQVAEHVWLVRVHGDYDLSNGSEIDAALARRSKVVRGSWST